MEQSKKAESHMISAASFVDGGIQEACDDACSICLEDFYDSDPATVTSCKHEFHLQCVLEWCQRSSNCPMCWQNLSLKDPTSQELLEAVERERSLRFTPPRNASIFHHPALGNFELQHVPVGVDASELEDRIIQHLAAAAAIGRTHRIARREGSMHRPSSQGREILVFPTQPNETSAPGGEGTQSNQISASSSRSEGMPITGRGTTNNDRNNASRSSLPNQDRDGPSEFQSLSDTWRSRFSCLSMKYKESIAKSTKELKEKLFSRSSSMEGVSNEVRREVNVGIATVSRMMERLEIRDNNRAGQALLSDNAVNSTVVEHSNRNRESTSYASSSVSR